jgi:branched-chain amino acid transport system permease protein
VTDLVQLLVFGLTAGAVVALSAAGFTLTFAVSRQVNLAHGNVFALTTVAVASLTRALGVTAATPLPARLGALLLLAVAGALIGALLSGLVERLAFRPFDGRREPLGPLIASLALSFLMLGAAVRWHTIITIPMPGHQGVNLPLLAMPDLVPPIELGCCGVSLTLKDLLVLLIGGGVAVVGTLALGRSRGGRLLRAIAEDPELVALLGANPRRGRLLGFLVAGALTGLAATIFTAYYGGTGANLGLRGGLTAMTAAFLGGIGNPVGALIGGVTIGVLSAFGDFVLSAFWTPVLTLLLLVGLLALRPSGMLGTSIPQSAEIPTGGLVRSTGQPSRPERRLVGGLLVLAALYPVVGWLLPGLLPGGVRVYDGTIILLLVALALGLELVVGFAGLLDLGYAAFFAIGGYTLAMLTGGSSRVAPLVPAVLHEPWLALPIAGLVTAAFGIVFGLPSIRARGEYLAIVTLALGEIVPALVIRFPDLTSGARGISGISSPAVPGLPTGSPLNAYGLALLLAACVWLAASRLAGAGLGRAWAAVRDDELAARSLGVDATGVKLMAFALGAGVAGIAGALFAGLVGHIVPEQFDLTLSLMVLAAVVIGGRWGLLGVVGGALLVALYDRVLVDAITNVLRALGGAIGSSWLQGADLRGDNFLVFGLLLYLATLLPGRSQERSRGQPPSRPLRTVPPILTRPGPASATATDARTG